MLLKREKAVYKHLGEYKGILIYLNISSTGLQFPFIKNKSLQRYLSNLIKLIQFSIKLLWVKGAIKSISFIYLMGVLQANISARNFLIADDLLLVLCDFSSSAIGDQNILVRQEIRYRKVNSVEPFYISVATKIFAISSLIYEIITKKRLYNKIEDKDKIKGLFRAQIFPLTVYILLRSIINKY